eukprot:PITA_01147
MLKIVPKGEILHEENLHGVITIIVASTTTFHMKEDIIEERIKEEEAPPMIVNISIILRRGQGTPGNHVFTVVKPGFLRANTLESNNKAVPRSYQAEASVSTNSSSVKRHCKQNQLKEGLRILQDTEQPVESSALYQSLLQSCIEKKALAEGKLVHAHIIQRGFMADIILASTLINVYAKGGGTLAEARRVFNQLPERDAVSWTVMIAAYSKQGHCEEAMKLFCQMKRLGFHPNEYTFGSILPACSDPAAVEEIHGQIVTCGFEQNVILGNTLVDIYAKCGSIENARYAFDKIPQPDVVSWTTLIAGYLQNGCVGEALDLFQTIPQRTVFSWTAMISGYVQNGHGGEALELFRQMQLTGVRPNSNTLTSILPACANSAALKQGMEIHAQATKSGLLQSDVFVENALVDMYGKCGSIGNACNVFGKMRQRNVISWTVMMAGFAKNGCVDEAFKLFQEMPVKNVISWTVLIAGCAQNGCLEEAVTLFQQMQAAGLKPNSNTFASVLSACANLTALEEGMVIHAKIIKNGFLSDVFVGSALVDMYAKCDSIENARKCFDRMPERNTVSWTTMIRAYVHNGHSDEALKLFRQMQVVGLKPDPNTFASILPACANLAALDQGKEIHVEIIKCKFQSDVFIANALVDMYAKCGSIKKARSVFDNVHQRDVVSWNAMISGYAMHGYAKEALALFEEMQQSHIIPDHFTLISVLSACCHAGLVEKGRQYFDDLGQRYHITPTMEHYGCMVDLLGRAGYLDEAHDLIKRMPIKPNATVWGCLLSACRVHTNIELGEYAAEHIIELDPNDAAPYIVLPILYAKAGRWGDIDKVHKKMKENKVEKNPGCSWIEVNKEIYAFLSETGHTKKPKTFIQSWLNCVDKSRLQGYSQAEGLC